jgi:carboxyl-terminal processing protease
MLASVRLWEGAHGALVAAAAALAATLLTSCGGASNANGPDNPVIASAQTCSANNPYRGDATAPITLGSLRTEKLWVRDYIDQKYLWFDEVPNINPSAANYSNESAVFSSLDNYFNDLLTNAITPSGAPKDQFSFIYPTADWNALINSGSSVGYGIEWYVASYTAPPRGIRVAYVHANSPASAAGVQRGDTLVLADGVSGDVPSSDSAGINTLNNALFPGSAGNHTFRFSRAGNTRPDVTLAAGNVTLTPTEHQVLNVGGQNVGYLLFNDHVLTAEPRLINAFTDFQSAGVTDLVLDLRYNGGGYLYIASQVAYMIAGAPPNNAVFERTMFSSKRASENEDTPFIDERCEPNPSNNFVCTQSGQLPTLNLTRVYVLASGSTCSASEAIINGLRGVGVDVRLIGGTTCGKPYGFFGQDNCGITYFPIEFKGVNAAGFGDYADGFVPAATDNSTDRVRGCTAADDLDRALGDPSEGQLAAALQHRANGTCPPAPAPGRQGPLSAKGGARTSAAVIKPAALTNRNGRKPTR